jgi:hypothetical protein
LLQPSTVIAVCFGGLFCLAPASLYLCWLAAVNRRDRPVVTSGGWDFVRVLAALSGFLLVGGSILLGLVRNHPQLFPELFEALRHANGFDKLRATFETQWMWWMALFGGYFAVIGLAVLTGFRGRGRTLAVYNVDTSTAEAAVEYALAQAGLTAVRAGNVWADSRKLVQLVPFHGARHATVRLLCPHPREREEIERHLRADLARAAAPDNPVAAWLSLLAGGAVFTVVTFVGLLLYILYVRY